MACVNHFESLPIELLELILDLCSIPSLKALSLVNHQFWEISAPFIFRAVKIRFSIGGLDILRGISISRVALFVKTLHYEASEIVDPCG